MGDDHDFRVVGSRLVVRVFRKDAAAFGDGGDQRQFSRGGRHLEYPVSTVVQPFVESLLLDLSHRGDHQDRPMQAGHRRLFAHAAQRIGFVQEGCQQGCI